jgi:hypothetical protein
MSASPALRNEILKIIHDNLLNNYFNVRKTLKLLTRN